MLLRESLSTHLSPVLRTIVYDTGTIVCITPKLVHNWLPHTAVTSCIGHGIGILPYDAVWTITDPGHADARATVLWPSPGGRASKRSSREFLIINQDEHIRDKPAFEMVIGGQLYPSQSCAALACTAGSVAYMYMLVYCLYIACTAGSVAYM